MHQWRWRFPYMIQKAFSRPRYLGFWLLAVLITRPRAMIGDRACRARSCHVLTAWRATRESSVCVVVPQKVGLGIGFIGSAEVSLSEAG